MSEEIPEYYSVGGRPVTFVQSSDGSGFILALDSKTHQWVYAPELLSTLIFWESKENVEAISKSHFETLVEANLGELPPVPPRAG